MVSKQGQKASRQGKKFEDMIAGMLDTAGAEYHTQVTLEGGSIFGKDKRIDFLITNQDKYPEGLYLELKWQDSNGTVEEKMPYTVACIKERYDKPTALVLGGDGITKGCEQWVFDQEGGNLVRVMYESEIVRFCMRNGFTNLPEFLK